MLLLRPAIKLLLVGIVDDQVTDPMNVAPQAPTIGFVHLEVVVMEPVDEVVVEVAVVVPSKAVEMAVVVGHAVTSFALNVACEVIREIVAFV